MLSKLCEKCWERKIGSIVIVIESCNECQIVAKERLLDTSPIMTTAIRLFTPEKSKNIRRSSISSNVINNVTVLDQEPLYECIIDICRPDKERIVITLHGGVRIYWHALNINGVYEFNTIQKYRDEFECVFYRQFLECTLPIDEDCVS